MGVKYWKVILRYGHVGKRREVSVARYIQTDAAHTAIDVMDLAAEMPGVKNRGVACLFQIDEETYKNGKLTESDNIFLQRLMTFNPRTQHEGMGSVLVC